METAKIVTNQAIVSSAPAGASLILQQYRSEFSALDFNLLAMILTEPVEFIDHEVFSRHNIETVLYGEPNLPSGSTHFVEGLTCDLDFSSITEETSLSTAQEIFLFQRYNYARQRMAAGIAGLALDASLDRLRELLAWTHRSMDARAQLARANLPLVLAMAKRTRLNGLDFNELVSEGNYALLRSVDKFDCARGFKFSTYACRAILKSFSRVAMRTSRYRGQFPTEFDPTLEKSDFSERRRDNLVIECVAEVREILEKNRAELSEIEQTVIRERFALNASTLPAKPKTLEQVGVMIGVTKERVRQIQNKALAKIRLILEDSLAA